MVNLSKLKAGDKVKFRCGGEAEVLARGNCGKNAVLDFPGMSSVEYFKNGVCELGDSGTTPFDIIEILPAPFDWKDVKPGMAFCWDDIGLVYFIGWKATEPSIPVIEYVDWAKQDRTYDGCLCPSRLTRAPEHDIEVQP